MSKELIVLIVGVFFIPALLTYFIAKTGWLIGFLVPLVVPILSIYTIHKVSFYWYETNEAPMVGGGAPMDGVVYILYGVPATLICIMIWFQFRQKKK